MELAGYIASLFIGISLGMIGGGGSVLTIPILVYLFHIEPVLATSYSLFIVGSTSAISAFRKWQKNQISLRVGLSFGIPSLITVYLIRKFLIPALPEIIFQNQWITVSKGTLTLVLFSFLMISAAAGMLRPRQISRPVLPEIQGLAFLGIITGIISGLLGAGGGFIIIPALVFYAALDMKTAIGTSLLIIALNSAIGFSGDLGHHPIDWPVLLTISALAISGSLLGNRLAGRLSDIRIRKLFAYFIMSTGLLILIKELIL